MIFTFQNDAIAIEPYCLVTLVFGVIGLATDPTQPILGVLGPGGAAPGQPDVDVIVSGIARVRTQQSIAAGSWLACSASGTADNALPFGQIVIGRSLQRSQFVNDVIDFYLNPFWI